MTPTAPAPRAWIALINPLLGTAIAMAFLKEQPRRLAYTADSSPFSETHLVNAFGVECHLTHAVHLLGAKVRTLDGLELPEGTLRIRVDQEVVLEEDLETLAEDRDPLLLPWQAIDPKNCLFVATEIVENVADGGQQLGFLLPNASNVEIWLNLEPLSHASKLEIELLLNVYDAGKRTLKGVKKA